MPASHRNDYDCADRNGWEANERRLPMTHAGYELSVTGDGRGDGVFATRSFQAGETVMVGEIDRPLPQNHSHATQIGPTEYVQLGGLGSKVNHSCDSNCGIRVNDAGAPDLVARRNIG